MSKPNHRVAWELRRKNGGIIICNYVNPSYVKIARKMIKSLCNQCSDLGLKIYQVKRWWPWNMTNQTGEDELKMEDPLLCLFSLFGFERQGC